MRQKLGIGLLVVGLTVPQEANGLLMVACTILTDHYEKFSRPVEFYRVQLGDTLGSIAKERFGDSSKYMEIADQNESITDPDLIYAGDIINVRSIESERFLGRHTDQMGVCPISQVGVREIVHPEGTTRWDLEQKYGR
jgi:hypothetical protein